MKKKYNKNNSLVTLKLHRDFKQVYNTLTASNWMDQLSLYLERIKNFSGDSSENRLVFGWVAGLCERAYYVAAHKRKINVRQAFEYNLQKIISSAPLPKFLTESGPVVCGKSQPSFLGAILPTLERYRVMERMPAAFEGNVDAIVIGGSMSYSPFFGIRENEKDKDFSDIDALVVINDNFFKKDSWNNFLEDDLFPLEEKQKFISRIKRFQTLLRDNEADVFSQRFSVCGKRFTTSIHFVTRPIFERMVNSDLKKSLQTRSDLCYVMRDFRVDPFFHPCHARHTFNGCRVETVIDGRPINSGGFIAMMPGYIISGGNFYPGVYQTVISTAFLVFYDCNGETKKLVKIFEKILYREARLSRKTSSLSTYARAHNRYDIFPPGRFEEGYNSYISPNEIKKYVVSCYTSTPVIGITPKKGEFLPNKKFNLLKNDDARNKVRKSLEQWKQKQLQGAEVKIANFINDGNFETKMLFVKNQGLRWYNVVVIPSIKQELVKVPYPYLTGKIKKSIIREEISTQTITPWEIMRLKGYEKLARKTRKVYVASIIDPADTQKRTPLSYAVVISVS